MAGVENALYIGGLNQANPEASDFISQGDDHLKLLKKCLQNTFPGFSRAIDGALFPWSQTPGSITVYAKFIEQTGRIGALEAFVSPTHPDGAILRANNNLSDVADPAIARANLGIPALADVLLRSQNLADLSNVATARANLGVSASSDVLHVAQNLADVGDPGLARASLSVPEASTVLLKGQNLADLTDVAAARSNLGVSATVDILLKANNLSDVTNVAVARANLDVPSNTDLVNAINAALVGIAAVTSVNGQTGDVTIALPVVQYDTLLDFPVSGMEGSLYIASDTGMIYRWNGAAYSVLLSELFGAPNGIATLAGDGKVTEAQLRQYMYANTAAFPVSGVAGEIYIAEDTNKIYRHVSAGTYVELAPSPDEVQQYANLAAFPATGEVAALYIAADTGVVYRWSGSAYVAVGLQPVADQTVLGNVSGSTATPVALTKTQAQTLLDIGWVTQSRSTAAPNTSTPAHRLQASGAETNIDVVLSPKGTGAFSLQMPDGTVAGGNKRGLRAVDLQLARSTASRVAAGTDSFLAGYDSSAGSQSVVLGRSNAGGASNTHILGKLNNDNGQSDCVFIGESNTVSSARDIYAIGKNNGGYNGSSFSVVIGKDNVAPSGHWLGNGNSSNNIHNASILGNSNVVNTPATVVGSSNTLSGNNTQAVVIGHSLSLPVNAAAYTVVIGRSGRAELHDSLYETWFSVNTNSPSNLRKRHLQVKTTDATPARLTLTGAAATSTNQIGISNRDAQSIRAMVIAKSGADAKAWRVEALVRRDTSTTTIIYSDVVVKGESAGAAGWTLAMSVDGTGAHGFDVTGAAATNISWYGRVEILELR